MSDILERVRKIVIEHLDADPEKVTEKACFIDDLGADSLDNVELVMAFEEEFDIEIPDDAAEHIQTVGDAVKFIDERLSRLSFSRNSASSRRAACIRAGRRLNAIWTEIWQRTSACAVSSSPVLAWSRRWAGASRRTWQALLAGKSGAGRITTFDPTDYACQVACEVPRVDGRGGGGAGHRRRVRSRPGHDAQGAAAHRRLHPLRHGRRRRGGDATRAGRPRTRPSSERTGVIIGSGIGGLGTIADTAHRAAREGPAARQPVLHPFGADQPGLRPGLDPLWLQGPEPRGGHRLRHRRPRGRRRRRG